MAPPPDMTDNMHRLHHPRKLVKPSVSRAFLGSVTHCLHGELYSAVPPGILGWYLSSPDPPEAGTDTAWLKPTSHRQHEPGWGPKSPRKQRLLLGRTFQGPATTSPEAEGTGFSLRKAISSLWRLSPVCVPAQLQPVY